MRMTPHDDTVEEHVQSSGIFVRESMPNVLSRRVWLKKKPNILQRCMFYFLYAI